MSPRTARLLLWGLIALLLAAIAGYAIYKVQPLLNPKVVARAPVDVSCNLRDHPCSVVFDDGTRVELSIEPRYIPPLHPLSVEVRVEGRQTSGAEIDLVGLNMNMGYNRPVLSQAGPNLYRGTLTIPVCVRNRMDWEATILLRTSAGLIAAPFRFSTLKAHAYEKP